MTLDNDTDDRWTVDSVGSPMIEVDQSQQNTAALRGLWLVVIALLVAGPLSAVVVGRGTHASALATITASAATAGRASRLTVTSTSTMRSATGATFTFESTAAFDSDQRVGRVTMTYEGLPVSDFETVFSVDTFYVRVPSDGRLRTELGKSWISAPVPAGGDAKKSSPGSTGTQFLEYLAGAKGDVTELGHETVDGFETTHYRVAIDPDEMLARSRRNQASSSFTPPGMNAPEAKLSAAPADVWLDADGRPRKLIMRLTVTTGGSRATTTTDSRYDYETPVDVRVPSADEAHPVASLTDAIKLLLPTPPTGP